MHINPNGLGQALIYPYYTVRSAQGNAYDTYMAVVNSSSSSKGLRVRFREGKNSRSVLDLNVYLGDGDVWTAAVTSTSNGTRLITADKSCTTPAIPASGLSFSNAAYSGSSNDNETATLDRTREGFMEIIEMGEITGTLISALAGNTGSPRNCSAVIDSIVQAAIIPGKGGLSGTGSLINVLNGVDYSYNAVALDGFSLTTLWQTAGNAHPDLSDVNPKTSYVLTQGSSGTTLISSNWQGPGFNPADPVSAILMRDNIINEFVLDYATLSSTDWVVTLPTKHFYLGIDPTYLSTPFPMGAVTEFRFDSPAQRPFQRNFGMGGACDDADIHLGDRESIRPISNNIVGGVPSFAPRFCWSTTVITFNGSNVTENGSNVLGSVNSHNYPSAFANGWGKIDLATASQRGPLFLHLLPNSGVEYHGLPVVGFMVQDFVNGTLPAVNGGRVLSNYGGLFEHKYTQKLVPVP